MFAIYKARDLTLGCTSSKEKLEQQAQDALQVIKYVSRIEHTVDIDKIRSILFSALNIVVYDSSIRCFGKVFPQMCLFVDRYSLSDQALTCDLVCNCFSVLCTGAMFEDSPEFRAILIKQAQVIFNHVSLNGSTI